MSHTLLPARSALRAALATLAFLLPALPAAAVEVKLARHPDYHNGTIVFSYLGDLWTAGEDGGNPKRLTVHRGRDVYPRFSPDGKWIAFSSDRYGNYDVFVMPATGGKAKQLTFHSANDTVVGWTPDSTRVVFTSARGLMYPGMPNLYEVPVGGGLEQPILTDWGAWGSYSPDGKQFAFNRHPIPWSRKHYRGSYAADLWVLDTTNRSFKRILDDKLPDEQKPNNLWPMFAAGGDIYFVSDRAVMGKAGSPAVMKSTNNLWKVSASGGNPVQVTKHASGALFFPSMSADGKVIVYEENFGLWKLDVASGKSTEIKINIVSDDQDNNLETVTVNGEADSFHVSPSGKRAVIAVKGELFTIATEKGDIRRLTATPQVREGQPVWSPDGKWIAFVGDQKGGEQVWVCDEFGKQMKQLSGGDSLKSQLRWAPNSKALLFTASDNKLHQYSFETGKSTVLAGGGDTTITNPQWSPDGKWVAYSRSDKTHLPHVFVIPAEGGNPMRVTDANAYSDSNAYWTADGKRLVFIGGTDLVNSSAKKIQPNAQIYSVSLLPETRDPLDKNIDSEEQAQKQAALKSLLPLGKVEVKIDFKNIGRRVRQLTRVGDAITNLVLSPDGRTVVFATSGVEGGRTVQSLWSLGVEGDKPAARVAQSAPTPGEDDGPKGFGGGFSSLQMNRDGKTLFYKQGNGIYALALGADPAATPKGTTPPGASGGRKLTFTVRVDVDHRQLRRQVFNEAWRVMQHRFYDPAMHGVDWAAMKQVYEPLLDHVADQEELQNVLMMMIGELNASHTGVSGGGKHTGGGDPAVTRFPGFELEADKSGYYKVTHVYRHGPADRDFVKLKAGDFILAVDDQPLKAGDNYWKYFTRPMGSRLEFLVNDQPAVEGAWKTKVTPVTSAALATLQYEKWVEERRAMVERLSAGEFGYLHIRQMSEPELRKFERDLAMQSTKKALVIDQRFNPGGNIDQELLQILQQKQYQYTKGRDATKVTRPLRGYFGAMVVLANERSTSDAEVFPDGFRTLKLGKVVGVTTYGAVIGTGAYQLMDGSMIRTPGMGLWNVNGTNLENFGVPPDVYVENTPEDFFRGRDAQLEKALDVLRQELPKAK